MNRSTTRQFAFRQLTAVAATAGLLLAACGDDADQATSTEPAAASEATSTEPAAVTEAPVTEAPMTEAPATEPAAVPVIELFDAWARSSPMVATAGAAYLKIENAGDADDALLSASVDPSIAAMVELHETAPAMESETTMGMPADTAAMGADTTAAMGGDMPTGSDAMPGGEMMEMRPVDRIVIPAGGAVMLEPGGYHIMLLDLVAPLEVGTTIEITLTFEVAGEMVVTAEVSDVAP